MFKVMVLLVSVVVVYGLHQLLAKWRSYVLADARAAVDHFPEPGKGHCPGDGAIKGRIYYDASCCRGRIWVLEVVLALLVTAACSHFLL